MKLIVIVFTAVLLYSVSSLETKSKLQSKTSIQNARFSSKVMAHAMTYYSNRFATQWPKTARKLSSAVNCDYGAITSFTFRQVGENRAKYYYECILPKKGCTEVCINAIHDIDRKYCTTHYTPESSYVPYAGVDATYMYRVLNRHPVMCPNGKIITYFKNNVKWEEKKYNMMYKCCPAKYTHCRAYWGKKHYFNGNVGQLGFVSLWFNAPRRNLQSLRGWRIFMNFNGRHWYKARAVFCNVLGR